MLPDLLIANINILRILQDQFDQDDREDVVASAVYPCTKHSKIDHGDLKMLDDEEGARFVFYMATVMPNSHGVFPRGAVIWNNSRVVNRQHRTSPVSSGQMESENVVFPGCGRRGKLSM